MSNNDNDRQGLSLGESLLVGALLAGMLYAAYAILKWIFTTPEGRTTGCVLLMVMAIMAVIGAIVGPPNHHSARAGESIPERTTSSISIPAVSVDQQFRTRIIGNQVCVTYQGGTDCTPINR